jgi:hypothetical protein
LAILIAHGRLMTLRMLGEVGWLAAFGFSVVALSLGWLFGGTERADRRTFSLATNMRDLALSLTLTTLAFPGLEVALPVFGVWLITFAVNVVFCEIVGRPRRVGEEAFA